MLTAFGLTIGVALVFMTVWFLARLVLSHDTRSGEHTHWGGISPIIVVSWLYGIAPAFITITTRGRGQTVVGDVVPFSGLANSLSTFLWAVLLACCIATILARLRAGPQVAPLAVLVALICPWLTTVLSLLLNSGVPDKHYIDYPIVAVTIWLSRPPIPQCLRLLGMLTVLTASLSLAMGLIKNSNGLMPNSGEIGVVTPAEGKAILPGPLLAGPFGHSNTLGITLALALPTVLALRKPQYKLLGVAIVFTALTWSASRTSLLAAGAVIAIASIGPKTNVRTRMTLAVTAIMAFALVWIPFNTATWTAFTDRGQIWAVSLHYWHSAPIGGQGPNFYDKMATFDNSLGPYAFYGHNMLVDTLTRLGLIGLAAMCVMLVASTTIARRIGSAGYYPPGAIVLAYVTCGLFEVPVTSFASFSSKGWIAIIPLLVIAFGHLQRPSDNRWVESDDQTNFSTRIDGREKYAFTTTCRESLHRRISATKIVCDKSHHLSSQGAHEPERIRFINGS